MTVLRPSETAWGRRYDLFCVWTLNGHIMMAISWRSFWGHFHYILGSFWEQHRSQTSSWTLSESYVCVGSRFNQFDSPHFEGFWEAFREIFADIFLTCLDTDFETGFHLLVQWFLMDFHTLWTSKSEQIRWEVVQKSNFRVVCHRMSLEIDFGRILALGWQHFWRSIGVQKRLGKQMLSSLQMREGRNWITTTPLNLF